MHINMACCPKFCFHIFLHSLWITFGYSFVNRNHASEFGISCAAGWSPYNGYCVQLVNLDTNDNVNGGWLDSNDYCETLNSRAHLIVEKDDLKMKVLLETYVIPQYWIPHVAPVYIHIGATNFDGSASWTNGGPLTWRNCTIDDTYYDMTSTGDCIKLTVSVLPNASLCLQHVKCNDMEIGGASKNLAFCQYYAKSSTVFCPPYLPWIAGPDGESCFYIQGTSMDHKSTWNDLYGKSICSSMGVSSHKGAIAELAVFQNLMELLWIRQHVRSALHGSLAFSALVGMTSQCQGKRCASPWMWINGSPKQNYLIFDPHDPPMNSRACAGLVTDPDTDATQLYMYLQRVDCQDISTQPYILSYRSNFPLYLPMFNSVTATSSNPSNQALALAAQSNCANVTHDYIEFNNCSCNYATPPPIITENICNRNGIVALAPKQEIIIESPNYPSNYGDSLSCSIHIQSSLRLFIQTKTFNTEPTYDYLAVISKTGNILKQYSGYRGPSTRLDRNEILLNFVTDSTITKQGFKITVTTYEN